MTRAGRPRRAGSGARPRSARRTGWWAPASRTGTSAVARPRIAATSFTVPLLPLHQPPPLPPHQGQRLKDPRQQQKQPPPQGEQRERQLRRLSRMME